MIQLSITLNPFHFPALSLPLIYLLCYLKPQTKFQNRLLYTAVTVCTTLTFYFYMYIPQRTHYTLLLLVFDVIKVYEL